MAHPVNSKVGGWKIVKSFWDGWPAAHKGSFITGRRKIDGARYNKGKREIWQVTHWAWWYLFSAFSGVFP